MNRGFPGGSGVKNLPANTGNTGAIPDLGRSQRSWSNWACAPQLFSLCSRVRELPTRHKYWSLRALEPKLLNKRSHHNEKTCTANRDMPLMSATREGPHSKRRPSTAKNKWIKLHTYKRDEQIVHGKGNTCESNEEIFNFTHNERKAN